MAETEDKTRRIRISRAGAVAVCVLLVLILAAAVFVVPHYGKAFAEFRTSRAAYKEAQAELSAAQTENAELTGKLENLKTVTADIDTNRAEVFKLAAQLEKDIVDGKTDKKICYITIDDGPYKRGQKYLELFDKYDIKATFFLTTANGNKLPDQADITASSMYPEYVRRGHTIGNHTYSHNYGSGGIYSSAKAFMNSVEKQQKFTDEATGGYKPQIIRFPGGTSMAGSNLGSIEKALRKKGYGWIDWTVDSGDSKGGDDVSKATIKKAVLNASKKQKIMVVLFHEWSQNSLDALPDIIESLEEKGYIFLPLFYDSVMVEK